MTPFWTLFFVLTLLNIASMFYTIFTAGLHQIADAKAKHRSKRHGGVFRPSVSLLIPAHNEEMVIERCLRSVKALDYPNFNILVINDGSTDATSQIAHRFCTDHLPNAQVVDIYPNKGKGGALNYVLQNYELGSITMILDADCTIAPQGLKNMVHYFEDGRVMAASANVRVNSERSLLGIFQQIEYIVGYYHKRHNSYTNSEFIIGGQGATYWTDTVKKIGGFRSDMQTEDIDLSLRIATRGNTRNLLVYGADCIIYTEGVPDVRSLFSQRYRWKFGAMQALWANHYFLLDRHKELTKSLLLIRIPQAIFGEIRLLFDLLAITLFVGLAILQHSPIILLGAIASISIYTGAIIAADHHTSFKTKMWLICINPLLFPLHVGMTLLNVIAASKMMWNWKQLFGKKSVNGSWHPPTRIARNNLG